MLHDGIQVPYFPLQPYDAKALPRKQRVNHSITALEAAISGDREELDRRVQEEACNHQWNAARCELP